MTRKKKETRDYVGSKNTLPTLMKEKGIPRAEAACIPSTTRIKKDEVSEI